MNWKPSVLWTAVTAIALAGTAWGQQSDAPPAPGQLVARVSAMHGSVSLQRGDTGAWEAGALNAPLVSGDAIATAEGGRAEVQLDFADWLRLAPNTSAKVADLEPDRIQIQVAAGTVELVSRAGGTPVEIDAPNMALAPQGAGTFRMDVDSDSDTHVIDRDGAADVNTPQGNTSIKAGDLIEVQGTGDDLQYQVNAAPAPDDFEQWCAVRDRQIADAQSVRYANPYYVGVDALDPYGHWVNVAGYGMVWAPDVAPGWAPYREGSWVWEPAWGWTWVSTEPWGWAPYHYGRWFLYRNAWVWWPGPVTPVYRPVWAPAYVSFVGLRVGPAAVGVGFGSIGWIALGPADPFRPWWGPGPFTTVAVVGGGFGGGVVVAPLMPMRAGIAVYSNIAGVGVNVRVGAAVTAVGIDAFGRGPVVAAAMVHVTPAQFRAGSVIGGPLPVVPVRASMRITGRAVAPPPAAARFDAAHFYSRGPAPPVRAGFDEEVAHAQQNGRGAAPADRPARGAGAGWQRFGAAGGQRPQANSARPPAQAGNGFRSFAGNDATRGQTAAPAQTAAPGRNGQPAAGGKTPPQGNGKWQSFKNAKPPAKNPKDNDGRGGGDRRF